VVQGARPRARRRHGPGTCARAWFTGARTVGGAPARRTDTSRVRVTVRHGTTTLFAALEVATKMIGLTAPPGEASPRLSRPWGKDVRNWIAIWNNDPKPYVWTRTAVEILERLAGHLNGIPAPEG
jgi:hypothetical protein